VTTQFLPAFFNVCAGRLSQKPDHSLITTAFKDLSLEQYELLLARVPGLPNEIRSKLAGGKNLSDLQDFWQTSWQFMILWLVSSCSSSIFSFVLPICCL
jgi:hypothetical protein